MPQKVLPAEIIAAMDKFTLAVRHHERAPIWADDGAALFLARDRLDAAILSHIGGRSEAPSMRAAPPNRTLGWVLRMILSSFALDLTYRLAPRGSERFRAAILDAEAAMRRDANLPERRVA